ncbi:LOW QUALITY PROTEIN: uncharacterized protein ACMZJ9_022217, partial [Mantella aurantiaca]
PVSVPVLNVSCLRNGSAEISCRVEARTKPNISLSVIGGSQEKYSAAANKITAIVGSPGPWNITCSVKNGVSQSEESRAGVTCPVPVSVPVLNVSCLRNGSAEISCRVEAGTKPNISLSVIGGSQEKYSTSANKITAIVGSPGPWNVTCSVKNGVSQLEESRAGVTCPAPLSDIVVVSSCILNGSVVAICSVKGSDPHYSWSLDGRFVSSHSRVTLPPPVSGTLCCDVTKLNTISVSINVSCAVPVSDPVLDVGCLQNGRAEISCKVEEGTDLSIYLTVNGESEVYNVTGSERTVHVIVPPVSPPNSWNISCWVKNQISQRSSNQTRDSCPGTLFILHHPYVLKVMTKNGFWSEGLNYLRN